MSCNLVHNKDVIWIKETEKNTGSIEMDDASSEMIE